MLYLKTKFDLVMLEETEICWRHVPKNEWLEERSLF